MKKAKEITLEQELKNLDKCFQLAKSRYSFNKEDRFLSNIALLFGVKITENKPIEFSDISIFYNQLVIITKDKYASRKFIEEEIKDIKICDEEKKILGEDIKEQEKGRSEISSVFISKFPDQIATLLHQKDGCEQEECARHIFNKIWVDEEKGHLLSAQTGAGKTYILASIIKNLLHNKFLQKCNCISPLPIVYVTKASVVEQTEKVFKDEFNIDTVNTVVVVNIELLRSKFGKLFVKEQVNVVSGVEHIEYVWNENIFPCLFIWDECQILAREESIQSKIAQGVNRITSRPVYQIFASATPFSRVYEARCFAVSTRSTFNLGIGKVELTDRNWKQFAAQIAGSGDPMDYNEAAIKRLVSHLDPYITRIKNIRPKHKAFNGVQKIHFQTKEEREEYETAWERYEKEKARLEEEQEKTGENSFFQVLAQLTIMRKAAEKCKRYHYAEFMDKTWKAGKAPVLACSFKGTITSTYKILVEDYNWKREDVSIIWGGSIETMNLKKKVALKMKNNKEFQELTKAAGIDLQELGFNLENLEEKTEEQLAFEKLHNLLTQKPEEREKEKMRFQKQLSKACFFTFKSGGVGLSLHHQYQKARPRETLLTPVYSEKELVQGLGRCPRITSLSDTYQYMVYYVGTVEESVAARVVMKLRNLKHVVKMRESWEDIFVGKKYKETEGQKELMDEIEEGNTMLDYIEEK
ncbi:MAG TPA: DEAD/DEAH box helicase family protein [Blattabacteriaceae bacterium]